MAMERGQTFATPATFDDARREIDRLKGQRRRPRGDAARERRAVSRDLRERAGGSSAVQSHELDGYGSTAAWKKTTDALLVIEHNRPDGTSVDGTSQGDGAARIFRRHGFHWAPNRRRWVLPNSNGRPADLARLTGLESALRLSSF
jgi:hypothetical protein